MGQHASKPSTEGKATSTAVQPKGDARPIPPDRLYFQALKRLSYVQTKEASTTTTTTPRETKDKGEDEGTQLPLILHTPPIPSQLSNLRQRLFDHLDSPPLLRRRQRHDRNLAYPRFDRTTAPHQRDQARKQEEWLRAFQHEFDLVFVVDDSTSMQYGQRWREVRNALAGVVMLYGSITSMSGSGGGGGGGGVDVVFVNHRFGNQTQTGSYQEQNQELNWAEENGIGGYTNLTTASQVHAIFNRLRPCGRTPFGTRLSHLLLPYLDHVESERKCILSPMDTGNIPGSRDTIPAGQHGKTQNTKANATASRAHAHAHAYAHGHDPVKPLYIVGITDGAFTDDAESILLQTARRLQGCCQCRAVPWQIQVQFLQVGDDDGARRFLEALEGTLRQRAREQGITRDVLVASSNNNNSNNNNNSRRSLVMGAAGLGNRLTTAGMLQQMMAGVQAAVSASSASTSPILVEIPVDHD